MKDLTQGDELKTIFYFSLPIFIGNLFQQLYNVADSVIVGNFLGKESLAAVGFSYSFDCSFDGNFTGSECPCFPVLWCRGEGEDKEGH